MHLKGKLLILISLLSSCAAFFPNFSINWSSKEDGTKCRERCQEITDFADGFCAAILSFTSTSICTFLIIENPFVCGFTEGSLSGMATFCGAGFLQSLCKESKCQKPFVIEDLFIMAGKNNQSATKIGSVLKNLTSTLEKVKEDYHSSMLGLTSKLEASVAKIDTLANFEKILSKLRFLSFMFHRIKPSENSTEQKAIKSHFLATAKDTTHQNGIIGLFTMFHGLLVGKGLSIYGPKRASIFEIDQSLCSISELIHLEMAILSLFSQMNFVYGQDHDKESQEDLRVLQNWQKELRMEQIQQIRKNCNTK